MAKFRITTVFTRLQAIAGGTPERQDYPAGSIIEPTNAEYNAFKDVLERVDDTTPVTTLGTPSAPHDPSAPYDPDAGAAPSLAPAEIPPEIEVPREAEIPTTRRR